MNDLSTAGSKGKVTLGDRIVFLKKQTNQLITQISHPPEIALWNIYPRKIETSLHTQTYIQMFITVLLVLPKTGNYLT